MGLLSRSLQTITLLLAWLTSTLASDLPRLLLPAPAKNFGSTVSSFSQASRGPAQVRRTRVNPLLTESASVWFQPGKLLRLDLLENQDITIEVQSVEEIEAEGFVVHGRSITDESSTVTLTLHADRLTGFMTLPGLGQFRITPTAEPGMTDVARLAPRPPGFCGTAHFPMIEGSAEQTTRSTAGLHAEDLPPADSQDEPTVIDVMFLYTPQTVIGEGSEEGVRRRVLESVDETNFRLTNSLINVRIHPVFIGLYNTYETGDMPTDSYRLANGTDGMERVPALRNDYKADLVCLVTEFENQGLGGQAWDGAPPKGDANRGFAVIRRIWTGRGFMVLAHEVGHLLGCAHDREHAGFAPDSDYAKARKPYMYGHRFEVEGVTYVDLMCYEPGIYVPYYGNPRLKLDGVPLGVSAEQMHPSDGARTINETAPYVARYRTARSRIEFTKTHVVVSEHSGLATVQLVRTGDLNTSTRVNVVFDATNSATATLDYTRPTSTLVNFATNQATAEIVIPVLSDGLIEGEESIRLSLGSVLGNHGIGGRGTCNVVILDPDTPSHYGRIEFPDGPLSVSEGSRHARIKVRLNPSGDDQPGDSLVLPYRTLDGTAHADRDYQAVSGTLTNTLESSTWEISVPVLAQSAPGTDRVFSLVVGSRTNSIRILDEQRPGALMANPGIALEAEGNLNARVRGDGKILVWGNFSKLSGRERTGIALLNPDGTVDDTFRPPEILSGHRRLERSGNPSAHATVTTVHVQPDGKLLLAGAFSRVAGQPRTTLVRLKVDGSLDEDFGRNLRFDGAINDIALQPDGRLVIGGSFERINGVRRSYMARLMPDGTVDESFKPKSGLASDWSVTLYSIALQADKKILVGGYFKSVDGASMLNLARLNPDGTLDKTFKLRTGASGPVWRIRVQDDGKIVVGGVFDFLGERSSKKLGRLNVDGTVDPTFRPPNPNADVNDIVCLPDGRLLVSGNFTTIASQARRFLALLKADGTLDPGLDLGTGPDRFLGTQLGRGSDATPIHSDGTLYLSGPFHRFNGLPAPNLVRLNLGKLSPNLHALRRNATAMESTVHGLPGGVYTVESSPDLERWNPVGEVRLDGYQHQTDFTVPPSTSESQFLRLKSQ